MDKVEAEVVDTTVVESTVVNDSNHAIVVSDQTIQKRTASEYHQLKENLLSKYHKNSASIYEKITSNPNGTSIEGAMTIIIEELFNETDNLKGNELVLTHDGQIHDATTISVKRAEILDTVSKVLLRKKDLASKSSQVDLDSGVFHIYQTLCFQKLTESLDELGYDDESKQVIVIQWGEKMSDWKSELKMKMEKIDNSE